METKTHRANVGSIPKGGLSGEVIKRVRQGKGMTRERILQIAKEKGLKGKSPFHVLGYCKKLGLLRNGRKAAA